MKPIEELTEVQRKVEAIIHNTTEQMRDAQPGVMAWRNEILRKIIEYRVELVNRLKPLNYTSISINHNAMTEQEAKKRIVEIVPNFSDYSESLQGVALTAFSLGHDRGYQEGMEYVLKTMNRTFNNQDTATAQVSPLSDLATANTVNS